MLGWGAKREIDERLTRMELGIDRRSSGPRTVRSAWSDGFGLLATRSLQIIVVVILAGGIIWGMRALTTVVIPILLALIFASTFAPVTGWLRRRNVPSALSAVIVLLGIVVLLSAIGWLIVWAVRDQWDDLSSQAEDGFAQVVEWSRTLPFMPDDSQLHEWGDQALDFITSAQFGSGALAGVGALTSFITGFVLMVVVLFFFLKDGPAIWRFLLRPFQGEGLRRAERAGAKTVSTLGSYVRGTAGVAAVDAVGIGLGLVILQVPLALPLAVLVFVLAFIPIVGATVAGILAALVALVSNGLVNALIVVGVVILVNQLEGNFLQPVLMGRALKLHSLVILLALTVGTVLSGILGAVLAVPLAAVAWGIVKVWDGADTPAKWARPHRTADF
ncbi:Predicted PurR-regulated permease PerM [Leucobacter chromiiresistens]|uniref:Predicted PurR-regulated permease PerM n=2 Tax=Leucobacter chromiiresistens TaxID=1079994 RepID=A0A1H0ZM02_9MICO|nr:Predicted PurR-regulated permease PerM [Leucobacter chromiiresistens]